jgi:anti-sigma regulatory factor (Ser/Thr protein kinase)
MAAVNELAANSPAAGSAHCGSAAGRLVCELRDGGPISDPPASRRPVDPTVPGARDGGRGLLLVDQLADLVRIHSAPGATTIGAYFQL